MIKTTLVQRAAALVHADFLGPLYRITVTQRSLTSGKLEKLLNRLAARLKTDGVAMRKAVDQIKQLERENKSLRTPGKNHE